jgi:hypothetical protein
MSCQNPFKGKIETFCSNQKLKNLSFDVTPSSAPEMKEVLMVNFKKYHLSPEEKRNLSQKHREQIIAYQSISNQSLDPYVEKLLGLIENKNSQTIHVKASHFGAFICLAAMYSKSFPTDVKVVFHLTSTPLSLFPKKWNKTNKLSSNITIHFEHDVCWQGNFKSLTQAPTHLQLPKSSRVELKARLAA